MEAKRSRILLIIAIAILSSGCATMIRGTDEPLSLMSEPSGALAEISDGQKCITPCQIILKRNQSVLIKFSKEGFESESVSVFPTLAGAGVILGGIIDYGTGAVYSLTPNPAHVILKAKPAPIAAPPIAAPPVVTMPIIETPQATKSKTSYDECIDEIQKAKSIPQKIRITSAWCSFGKITKDERNKLQAAILRGEI